MSTFAFDITQKKTSPVTLAIGLNRSLKAVLLKIRVQVGVAKCSKPARMSQADSTLDACLKQLPGLTQERIRSWRWAAWREPGLHGRPQIFHPVRDSRGGQQVEVWEQAQEQLGCGGYGCVVVKQTKVSPPTGPLCPLEHRAVKIIPVDDKRWKYYLRELDALIRFSGNKVSSSSRKRWVIQSLMKLMM